MAIPSGHFKIFQAQRVFALTVAKTVGIADLELRAHITRISQFPLSVKFRLGLLVASYANQQLQQVIKHAHSCFLTFRGTV